MRVLLAGIFRRGHLADSYRRAFEGLGHEVLAFDIEAQRQSLQWWLRDRIGHRLTIRNLWARRTGSELFNRNLRNEVQLKRPDLVVAFNGDFVMPETVRQIRRRGIPFVIFHADNPFQPHYNARPETLHAARECTAFLIWSEALVTRLRGLGVPAGFLAFGWDSEVFPYSGIPDAARHDVVFVGGWDRRREIFLNEIARHFDLKIWGPSYWGERARANGPARHCWQGSELAGDRAAAVFADARINLNILRDQHYVDGAADGVIMRTFEVPGAGGFLLATRSGGATNLFPEDAAAGYFGDVTECLNRIDHYLMHDLARREAAKCAHDIVDSRHRYGDRVRDLLEFV